MIGGEATKGHFATPNSTSVRRPHHHHHHHQHHHHTASATFSVQQDGSTTPTNILHWRSIGKNENISGSAVSSELFAFLGTEERTKTRILRTIAGYTDARTVTLNGVALTSPAANSSMLDVQDAINLYESLSVLETLVFSAELRRGTGGSASASAAHSHHSPARRRSSFEGHTHGGGNYQYGGGGYSMPHLHHQPAELLAVRLLTEMGLEGITETRVGDLSVWQRRVVLFATEVIAGKDVLYFDRPTSDLDAQSALAVVTSLQRLARGNRLVAITASSLTFREYAMLDRIQLLSKNGAIYYGLGSGALAYFEKLSRTPSPGASISDFLLDLVDEESDIFPGYRGLRDISTLESIAEGLFGKSPHYRSQGLGRGQGQAQGQGKLSDGRTEVIVAEEGAASESYEDEEDDEEEGGERARSGSDGRQQWGLGLGLGLGLGGGFVGSGGGGGGGGVGIGMQGQSLPVSYSGAPRGFVAAVGSSSSGSGVGGGSGGDSGGRGGGSGGGRGGGGDDLIGTWSRVRSDSGSGSGPGGGVAGVVGRLRSLLRGASLVGAGDWVWHQLSYRAKVWGATAEGCVEGATNCDCSIDEEEDCPGPPLLLKQFSLCLWRGMTVRYRNSDQLYGCWLLAGVLVAVGLVLTFRSATDSLDDKMALLTVLPFSMVLLSNLWNDDDYNDRRIFAYERDRGYFSAPVLSPLTSLLADICLYKLFPPVFAAATLYPVLGLRDSWAAWVDFLLVVCLVQVAGACFAKAVFSVMAMMSAFVPVKAAMVTAFLLSVQVLYTGLLVDLSRTRTHPPAALATLTGKDLSIFYWGCNVLYWGELSGQTASTTSTGEGPVLITGEDLLRSLSVAHERKTTAYLALSLHATISLSLVLLCSTLRLHQDWRLTKLQRKKKEQEDLEDERDAADPVHTHPH